jgi:GT2 family glycosyltransferase
MQKDCVLNKPVQESSQSQNVMVSIIISNYNGEQHLHECLSSLMQLDYSPYEVIVVDAASSDNSVAIVEHDFPRVRLIKKGKIGIGEALNCGMLTAKGELIVFDLNNDDIVDKKWLARLVNALMDSPNVGVVCGKRFKYRSNSVLDSAGGRISFLTGNSGQRGHNELNLAKYNIQKEIDYAEVIAIRKSTLEKVGLCDPVYYIYYEDTDFCLRIKRFGYKIVFVPSAILWHKGSSTVGQQSKMSYYYMYRNQIRCILKNYPLRYLISALSNILFIQNLLDIHLLVPPIGKTASKFYPFLRKSPCSKDGLMLIKVRAAAIIWNFKNLRNTVMARYQVM